MRGTLMTTLAGGTREPRAWKLASVVRGGAVGKGLCYSTSLAAYSTLAARASHSSNGASCWAQDASRDKGNARWSNLRCRYDQRPHSQLRHQDRGGAPCSSAPLTMGESGGRWTCGRGLRPRLHPTSPKLAKSPHSLQIASRRSWRGVRVIFKPRSRRNALGIRQKRSFCPIIYVRVSAYKSNVMRSN
jgi:hypothetical protein